MPLVYKDVKVFAKRLRDGFFGLIAIVNYKYFNPNFYCCNHWIYDIINILIYVSS